MSKQKKTVVIFLSIFFGFILSVLSNYFITSTYDNSCQQDQKPCLDGSPDVSEKRYRSGFPLTSQDVADYESTPDGVSQSAFLLNATFYTLLILTGLKVYENTRH